MIILKKTAVEIFEQFRNATRRAINYKPIVKKESIGNYLVQSENDSEKFYRVHCRRDALKRKIVSCECKAGENGLVCKHSAVAVQVHIDTMRRQVA